MSNTICARSGGQGVLEWSTLRFEHFHELFSQCFCDEAKHRTTRGNPPHAPLGFVSAVYRAPVNAVPITAGTLPCASRLHVANNTSCGGIQNSFLGPCAEMSAPPRSPESLPMHRFRKIFQWPEAPWPHGVAQDVPPNTQSFLCCNFTTICHTGGKLFVCSFNHSRIAHSWSFFYAAHINGTLNADHCKRRTSLGVSPPGSTWPTRSTAKMWNSVAACTTLSRASLCIERRTRATLWSYLSGPRQLSTWVWRHTNLNLLFGWSTSPLVSVSDTSETWISRLGSRISSWDKSAKRLSFRMGALCCRGHVLAASQLTKTGCVPSFATLSGSGANGSSSDKKNTSGPDVRSCKSRLLSSPSTMVDCVPNLENTFRKSAILLRRCTGPGCEASPTRWPRYPYRCSRFTSIKTFACLKIKPCWKNWRLPRCRSHLGCTIGRSDSSMQTLTPNPTNPWHPATPSFWNRPTRTTFARRSANCRPRTQLFASRPASSPLRLPPLNAVAHDSRLPPTGPPRLSTVQFLRWGSLSLDSPPSWLTPLRPALAIEAAYAKLHWGARPLHLVPLPASWCVDVTLHDRVCLGHLDFQWPFLGHLFRFWESTVEGIDFGALMAAPLRSKQPPNSTLSNDNVPELCLDRGRARCFVERAVANALELAPAACLSVACDLMMPPTISPTSVEVHGEPGPNHLECPLPITPLRDTLRRFVWEQNHKKWTRRAHKQHNVRSEMTWANPELHPSPISRFAVFLFFQHFTQLPFPLPFLLISSSWHLSSPSRTRPIIDFPGYRVYQSTRHLSLCFPLSSLLVVLLDRNVRAFLAFLTPVLCSVLVLLPFVFSWLQPSISFHTSRCLHVQHSLPSLPEARTSIFLSFVRLHCNFFLTRTPPKDFILPSSNKRSFVFVPLLSLLIHVAHRLLSRDRCVLMAWNFVFPHFLHELLLQCLSACSLLLLLLALLTLVFSSAAHPARDLNHASVSDIATLYFTLLFSNHPCIYTCMSSSLWICLITSSTLSPADMCSGNVLELFILTKISESSPFLFTFFFLTLSALPVAVCAGAPAVDAFDTIPNCSETPGHPLQNRYERSVAGVSRQRAHNLQCRSFICWRETVPHSLDNSILCFQLTLLVIEGVKSYVLHNVSQKSLVISDLDRNDFFSERQLRDLSCLRHDMHQRSLHQWSLRPTQKGHRPHHQSITAGRSLWSSERSCSHGPFSASRQGCQRLCRWTPAVEDQCAWSSGWSSPGWRVSALSAWWSWTSPLWLRWRRTEHACSRPVASFPVSHWQASHRSSQRVK